MTVHPAHPVPRARPFADPSVEALIERAAELARRWAVALVQERSLEGLREIPLEQLALEAPALCGQLLRALSSESELALLLGCDEQDAARRGGAQARRIAALAGASDAAALIAAVEALRGVIWEALLTELDPAGTSHARRLADSSDRLAYVCSALLPAALGAVAAGDSEQPPEASASEASAAAAPSPDLIRPTSATIVIVDERRHEDQAVSQPRVPEREPIAEPEPRVSAHEPVVAPEPSGLNEIEVRDERGEEGPAAWIGSIGRQLERFEEDHLPFAVLLVELSHQQAQSGLADALENALEAMLGGLGGGSLTRERDGRYWLLAPRTDRSGAAALAERLSTAAAAAGASKGVEVSVAVGTAVCPQDGRQASSLAAHADIGLYAARSRSRPASRASVPGEGR